MKYPKRLEVNSSDVLLAIKEGCNPMRRQFDPDHGHLPYFENVLSGSDPGNFHHMSFSMSHVPGRWLDALLNAQDVAAVDVPDEVIGYLRKWALKSVDNPMALPALLDLQTFEPLPICDLHNLRDVSHALVALVRYRQDGEAAAAMDRLIETVNKYFNFSNGAWDEVGFHRETGCWTFFSPLEELTRFNVTEELYAEGQLFPRTFGRYVGSLVKYYLATGKELALSQATRLAEHCVTSVVPEDGSYDPKVHGTHTHSTTSMLSGVSLLGRTIESERVLDRVAAFVENGLTTIANDLGWCTENYNRTNDYGEINNTSDMVETCLNLALSGRSGYLQRAERMLRCHFLPAQLLDTSFVENVRRPSEDWHDRLAERCRGAFGFPCPYGLEDGEGSWISFNWDIVGGAVGGLCDVYRSIVSTDNGIRSVNLLFEHSDSQLEVHDPYRSDGVLTVEAKSAGPVRIRTSNASVQSEPVVTVLPGHCSSVRSGEWIYVFGVRPGDRIEVRFDWKRQRVAYPIKDEVFTFELFGDAVEAASSNGRRLCFFPEIAE